MHIVEVIVGHSSTRLPENNENGHTHKWTLFVKPGNRDYDEFPDNKLIQKVKFEIHESFAQPVRFVTKPPFKITETGFASFTTLVTIFLNLPNEKPRTIPYELTLFTGDQDVQLETQKLVVQKDVPPAYLELIKKYARTKKRKASLISNDEKSPSRKMHKITPVKEEESSQKMSKSKEKGVPIPKIDIEIEKASPKKEKKEKVKSPEELTRRLNECTDSHVIYKASEYLLTLPDTKLSQTTLKLSFDLSRCDSTTLMDIGRILKGKKAKK
ncbi:YEATS domain-containing protein [Caenorhabditis elegans]|uniref:YEATS domain-containing protein n=1 Tax=Caenorhabditis elegans TaxID=6239 RepID=Q9NF15_CAEEL|nr:AF-9 ANC1 homology domain-containing protein [Caenorhabditis elegans]CAB60849.2 AF-9 ANC1 homology domain-containing protein [Caenorhabditis elegans]|eukprot:NP_493542.2 Uncharacterized protein CELE_Y105E8B.7 [Caenorhabditis elegans]